MPLKVGISSCLLGERVRYNGGHKRAGFLEALEPHVEWVSVCPEVEVGMGVPREPVRLERSARGTRMMAVESRVDHTDAMRAWAERRIDALVAEGICGYVLKKDSPSCGLRNVDVHDGERVRRDGRGLFADALLARLPDLPVEEEDELDDPGVREEFFRRCMEYGQLLVARVGRTCRAQTSLRPRVSGRDDGAARLTNRTDSPLEPYRRVRVVRYGRTASGDVDVAATEEPLEIRLRGRSFCVIMRTPGEDRTLAAGFLFAEGIIRSAADLGAIEHCRHPHHPEVHNVVDVYLVGEAAASLDSILAQRGNVLTSSSCGLCGRTTIESLRVRAEPLPADWTMTAEAVTAFPDRLREHQAVFEETGGLHAAGLFTASGTCEGAAEDVGRHNAVDKVIGAKLLDDGIPLARHVLVVSGRASYEIVQKAWLAGIRAICAVSAPSTLAVELAEEAGITLLGFVRDRSFNIYSHEARIIRDV